MLYLGNLCWIKLGGLRKSVFDKPCLTQENNVGVILLGSGKILRLILLDSRKECWIKFFGLEKECWIKLFGLNKCGGFTLLDSLK